MGGLSPDHTRWVHLPYLFFLPIGVLKRVFRRRFVRALKLAYRQKKLRFYGQIAELEHPKRFAAFLRTVYRKHWVVYAKPALGSPLQVLRYLGRYTHRVAISNHRLLAFDGERVTFRWKDYTHGNKQRKMTLTATEFLRRFVQHILPRGFVRIRQYGFLANRCRAANLALGRQLLVTTPKPPEACPKPATDAPTWRCPQCGARDADRCQPHRPPIGSTMQILRQLVTRWPVWRADVQLHGDATVCLCCENRCELRVGAQRNHTGNRLPARNSPP
jgi:hypothetical protein